MTGMDVLSKGQVIVEGYDVGSQTSKARESIGVVLQEPILLSDMTVHEHLLFFGSIAGLLGEQLVHRALELENLLQLKDVARTRADDLRMPVQRRLDLALAILPNPRWVSFLVNNAKQYATKEILSRGNSAFTCSHLRRRTKVESRR
ncbi:hypothetical protein HPB48_021463 [Haemaphysalis longicornis]|uniref:Uncharacterized protein n=1 Tax=Haemaphysalis longicornis TaxID=44386 RepID=A0A9J6FX86_HAELO|nr:hypothetical protein HPB48_021463 [Haemaphysalis longicornis]